MKQLLVIISFFVSVGSFAQRTVQENLRDLEIALVNRDSVFLNKYLHDNLSYGHSNGWVEKKDELVKHLFNGKLKYNKIESKELSTEQTDDVSLIRLESNIKYVLDGKEGALKLHVLQVWLRVGYEWKLLSRQGTKIN
jgi:hypothetical protein